MIFITLVSVLSLVTLSAALILHEPRLDAVWYYTGSDNAAFLESGYKVRWSSENGASQTAKIQLWEEVCGL
jgi:hypothetical protein